VHETSHNCQGRDTGVSPPAAATTATPWLRYWVNIRSLGDSINSVSVGRRQKPEMDIFRICLLIIHVAGWSIELYSHYTAIRCGQNCSLVGQLICNLHQIWQITVFVHPNILIRKHTDFVNASRCTLF